MHWQKTTRRRRRGSLLLLPLLIPFLVPGPSRGQVGTVGDSQAPEGITLPEVLSLASENNPRIRAAGFQVEASLAREPGAGLLPDPTLQIGVMNLALPEFSADMPASMAPSFQAMQRIPLAGKLSLQGELARRSTKIQEALALETWWQIRTETAGAFYRVYETDRRKEVLDETLGLLRDFERIARAMYASGSGRQADVLRASVEVARMEAEIRRLEARRTGAASSLNALLNRPADTAVPSPVLGPMPTSFPTREELGTWALDHRPLLEGMQGEVEQAETRVTLAEKDIWPDLTVGLQYGLGRMDGDLKSMGGASVGFSLPIFAGKRQMKARDEASAARAMSRARFDEVQARVDARITEVLADLEETRTLLALYREEILPQARTMVESSLSSYRVGAVDFMTLVDAQMAVNRFQGEYYGLLAEYGTAVAQLEMTIGRDLPVTEEMLLEDS